jgi:uncharacterized protein
MALSPMTTTFRADGLPAGFVINAYGPGYVSVNGQQQTSPFLLEPQAGITLLGQINAQTIRAEDLQQIPPLTPEVVLIGTGERQSFLHPRILAPLIDQRIGVECMGLAAACRTYNILMGEGRRVVGVFLFE